MFRQELKSLHIFIYLHLPLHFVAQFLEGGGNSREGCRISILPHCFNRRTNIIHWLNLWLIRHIQQHDIRTWNAHDTVDALMLYIGWMTEGLTHLCRIVEYSVSINYGSYRCILLQINLHVIWGLILVRQNKETYKNYQAWHRKKTFTK